jgi:hypothetical protein
MPPPSPDSVSGCAMANGGRAVKARSCRQQKHNFVHLHVENLRPASEFVLTGLICQKRPQIFRCCFVFPHPKRNLMRRPVVLHHPGMVNRNIGGTLSEMGYGIAAGSP